MNYYEQTRTKLQKIATPVDPAPVHSVQRPLVIQKKFPKFFDQLLYFAVDVHYTTIAVSLIAYS